MPKHIDPHARGEQVHDAVRDLVVEGGIEAVSIRAVAARAGLATSSIRHQYRDKAFLLRCVVHECTERFNRKARGFRRGEEPVQDVVSFLTTQLPVEDEVADVRLWLALVERARAVDDDTRDAVDGQRADWRAMAGHAVQHLGVQDAEHELEAQRLALLLEATLAAMCDPRQALDRAGAIEILRRHVEQLAA